MTTPLPWHATPAGPYTSERFKAMVANVATHRGIAEDVALVTVRVLIDRFGIAPAPDVCGECSHARDRHPSPGSYATCADCPSGEAHHYRPATADQVIARQAEELANLRAEVERLKPPTPANHGDLPAPGKTTVSTGSPLLPQPAVNARFADLLVAVADMQLHACPGCGFEDAAWHNIPGHCPRCAQLREAMKAMEGA